MINVVLADDHHLVRQGIRALLDKAPDIHVIGEAEDGQQALELVDQLKPDVLIIDIAMPRLSGIQVLDHIRALGLSTKILVLSMYFDHSLVKQALKMGATGYLLKRSVVEELLVAVRAAERGESYLSPAISAVLVNDYVAEQDEVEPIERLSTREREVLKLIAEGHTNSEIAGLLYISVKTTEKHRANLMAKLDVHDLVGLIRIAIRYGFISLDE